MTADDLLRAAAARGLAVTVGPPAKLPDPPAAKRGRKAVVHDAGPVRRAVSLHLACRVVSEMNRRDHWTARRKRFQAQADELRLMLAALDWWSPVMGYRWPFGFPVTVTLARVGGRATDGDNLASAFKGLRDAVALWAGVDDADPRITWQYAQEPGSPAGVRVTIETGG